MRQLLLFLLFVSSINFIAAQNSVWFPPGAKWVYSYVAMGNGPGNLTIDYDGATVIDGQECVRLKHHFKSDINGNEEETTEYLFSRNDSVFIYWAGHFELVYDFTRVPGETSPVFNGASYDYYLVVDTGSVNWQGIPLRYQDVILKGPEFESEGIRIFERIGGPFLYFLETSSSLVEATYYLGCYKDDQVAACESAPDLGYVPVSYYVNPLWLETHFAPGGSHNYEYKLQGFANVPQVGFGDKLLYRESGQTDWNFIGLFSEDRVLETTYFVRTSSIAPPHLITQFPLNEWVMIYDFHAKPGDTMAFKPKNKVVKSVDSIQIYDGSFRTKITFETGNPGPYETFWIEGIGSNLGLFGSMMDDWTDSTGNYLSCYFTNGTLRYSHFPAEPLCLVAASEPDGAENVKIFPNPSSGRLTIDLPETFLPARVTICDLTGKVIHEFGQSQSIQQIENAGVPEGLFIISIVGKNGMRSKMKWCVAAGE